MNTLQQAPKPPGVAPSLARLAYNRLTFGPRPADLAAMAAFDLTAFVDRQLNIEAIDDSACNAALAAIPRTDPDNIALPPLEGSLQAIKTYAAASEAAGGYAEGNLHAMLNTATYARALLSERQLFELMVDFWTNHFQTNFKSATKYWEDHHVIRQHAFGNFRDLLGASAKSPSMLDFLSNRFSDGGNPNENYARELMELHTVGSYNRVLGPDYLKKPNYTEKDVAAAAQILSGWTSAHTPDESFAFNGSRRWPAHHWPEKRMWLGNDAGYTFPHGGIEQGEMLLDILAEHPSTAYFISFKLCRRFISDYPDLFCPDAIEAGAQAFLSSHGDVRTTLRAILLHPKFAASWGEKIKRPFESFVGVMRGLDSRAPMNFVPAVWTALGPRYFQEQIEMQGQVLFEFSAPTGYADIGLIWWSTNQVFSRWTTANGLVSREFGEHDTFVNSTKQAPNAAQATAITALVGGAGRTAAQVVDRLLDIFVGRAIDPADRTALVNYLGANNAATVISSDTRALRPTIGMIAASPYAQWR
jgi:uncharacterized protein (DUF1800 family)